MRRLLTVAALSFVVGCYLAGLAVNVLVGARVALVLYGIPAALGFIVAVRWLTREVALWRFEKAHPMLPTNLSFDAESGVALVSCLGGALVSVAVPAEVVEEGPHAVVAFVRHELDT